MDAFRPEAKADDPGGSVEADEPPLLPWMSWLLRFAGCYNLLVGLTLVLFYHELFKTLQLAKPSPVMFVQLVGLLVGLFGAGYLLVARARWPTATCCGSGYGARRWAAA